MQLIIISLFFMSLHEVSQSEHTALDYLCISSNCTISMIYSLSVHSLNVVYYIKLIMEYLVAMHAKYQISSISRSTKYIFFVQDNFLNLVESITNMIISLPLLYRALIFMESFAWITNNQYIHFQPFIKIVYKH